MSGHSKWHSIKHKKGANDAKRGKILNKHSKILMVVGRNDPNPETNATLRAAIANAKADNVPNDNISRILKKLSGDGKDATIYSELVYEGFGPEGIPFVITALSDNVNRTFPAVKTAFAKNGGTLGSSGSVMFMFDHLGIIVVKNGDKSEDELFEIAIEAGADDFEYDAEGESEIITKFANLGTVAKALEGKVEVVKSAPEYRAKDPKIISDAKTLAKVEKFIEAIEEVDDVDDVFGGFDVSDDLV